MKILQNFTLAVPVLRLSTKVTHSTPRKPTVFERLILDLCQQQSQLNEYQGMSLSSIFENILNIPEPNDLVKPAFDNLVNLSILRGFYDDLGRVSLSQLQFSEHPNVNYFIERGQLAAHPRENIIEHDYHSVQRSLERVSKAQVRDHQVVPALPDSLIGDFFPAQAIEADLKSANYPWLSKNSEITQLAEVEREIRYLDSKAELRFDGGFLNLGSQDEALDKTLKGLPSQDRLSLMRQVIAQYNGQPLDAAEWKSASPLTSNRANDFINQQTLLRPVHDQSRAVVELGARIRTLIHIEPGNLKMPLPKASAALTVCCAEQVAPVLTWKDEKAELVLPNFVLPAGFQWLEGCLQERQSRQLQFCEVRLPDCDGEEHTLRLVGERMFPQGSPLLEQLVDRLEVLIKENAHSESWQRLRSFWTPAAELWKEWLDNLACPTLRQGLEILKSRYQLLNQVSGQQPGHLEKDLLAWLQERLAEDLPLTRNRLELAVQLGVMIDLQDQQLRQEYLEWLQDNSQPPETYLELADYARLVAPFGDVRSSSRWLLPGLLANWQASCGHSHYRKVLGFLPVAGALNDTHQALTELQDALDEHWDSLASDKPDIKKLAKALYCSTDHKHYRQKFRQYQRAYGNLVEKLTPYPISNDGQTLICRVNQAVERYLSQLELPEFLLESSSNILVVDSCFLINEPNFSRELRQGELLLVPRKVHEELDNISKAGGGKKNSKARQGARKAIQALERNERGNILAIDACPALLPPEYERDKADNLILSAVLRYRMYDSTLLTDDKNLTVKAKGLGITTCSAAEYQQSLTSVSSKESEHPKTDENHQEQQEAVV